MRLTALRLWALSFALSCLGVAGGLLPATAAAAPAHTDVMFVFDTTGSMGSALTEATAEIEQSMTDIRGQLPDVQFGLAEMRDYSEVQNAGEFAYDIGNVGSRPWTLKVPVTTDSASVKAALATLEAEGGGDSPEAYGRALYETAQNPAVGWRPGARGVIVLVADNVPHDTELNEGIAAPPIAPPFNTGVDPGADNIVGTADDLDFQSTVLPTLVSDGKPLEFVDYHGLPEFLPYWQNWSARTGGNALEAGEGGLAAKLTQLVVAGANAPLPSCPAGTVRDATEHCVAAPAPLPAPSNAFSVVPRVSCVGGCHVVLVKVTFDSAGNVVMESVLPAGSATMSGGQDGSTVLAAKKPQKKKPQPLIKRLSQAVVAGSNTIKVKLTPAAVAQLKSKGHLKVKVRATFTPTGGTPKSSVITLNVKPPLSPKKSHH